MPTFADYLALVGAGMHVAATGDSDSHRKNGSVGYPRSFLTVDKDDPSAVTPDDLRAAIRAQRTSVGEGCLMELYADGARRQGVAELVGSDAQVKVKLQAPPHVTPGTIELYVNGISRPLLATPEGLTLDAGGELSPSVTSAATADAVVRLDHALAGLPTDEGDLAIVAVSKNGSGLRPTGGGSAFCFSGALYVDVDGDGSWTPWLAGTQQLVP